MKKALLKDTIKEIKNTFKRFISILLVVLLGVGFFAGIKAASPDMKMTVDQYFDEQKVMDIEVISTLGLTKDDINTLQNVEGVENVVSSYAQDVIVSAEGEDSVVKMETITNDMNKLKLLEGKLPNDETECVVEKSFLSWTGHSIGDTIEITAEKVKDDEGNEKDILKQNKIKIVGVVQSPLYISRERGSSKLGAGKVNYYMYIHPNAITQEIYTNLYISCAGASEAKCYDKKYENIVEDVKNKIEEISEERKQARYNEIYTKAEDKIKEAQETLNKEEKKANKEINDAQNKIDDAKEEVETGKTQLMQNRQKANSEFESADKQIKEAEKTLNSQQTAYEKTKKEAQKQIEENKEQLKIMQEQGMPESITAPLAEGIKKAELELEEAEAKLKSARQQLEKQKKELERQKSNTYAKLNSVEAELTNAEKEISQNEKNLKEAKKEAEEKITDAKEELEEAKFKLKDIKKPEWYILDRNQNVGYASYIQDTDRIANIATVFPVVFFVVAALISLTSMSRMVEEERVQIGTLKALGYTKLQIASKYIIYAMLATIIGSGIGLAIGFNVLPKIVMNLYGMMYTLPEGVIEFNTEYTIISVTLAMICTVGAAIYSCAKALRQLPATLMRPKAPKPGKRVFLEKITFIWSHLSFTRKVTARNIFRYKKRFLMTIIGVMGCTALIVAGFGLRDSISQMIPSQYGEIFKYHVQISLKDNLTTKQIKEEIDKISHTEGITEKIVMNIQAVDITNISNTQNIQMMIPENSENLSQFITLKQRGNKNEIYTLNQEGVIITEKLAKLLDVKVGDTLKIKNSDDIEAEVKISNITENYLMHYIYMTKELYQTVYKEDFKPNTIYANIENKEIEEELGHKLLENNKQISGVTFTSNTENVFSEIMDNMNLVVWILIISAGLLAFVVLYNLSNTNISERIRELATIKVLGFYDKEVYDYVSKETTLLTIIGIIIGLLAGYFLTFFIVNTCELDMMMFDKRVNFISYVYGVIITLVFGTIVNIATYFALRKIDMIESLKSIE